MSKQLRTLEMERKAAEVVATFALLNVKPVADDVFKSVDNYFKQTGAQLSKDEKAWLKVRVGIMLSTQETTTGPETAGSSAADAQNIGASTGDIPEIEIIAPNDPSGINAKSVNSDERVKFKFDDFLQMESDGSFKVKLPKSEEEIGDLLAEVAPKFKDSAVKGVAAATSYILAQGVKSGIQGTVDSKLNDIWTKNSSTYQETGKLHPKEKAVMDGFANLANSFLSGIFGK